uniref:hypothetical protein n=1 Tax=Trichocoleus desertorum TaxID=1481672 RepID=UPI0025B44B55|nr:hypothetical protein [Trichocoleus desertorum]
MTQTSTESQTNAPIQNGYDALANMVNSLTSAIKDLPILQRLVGMALVVGLIPVTFSTYSLAANPDKLLHLASIFLLWISSMLFIVHAFSERQLRIKRKQAQLDSENTRLEELRTKLLDAVEDKHQSFSGIESQLLRISNQVSELLQVHPETDARVNKLKESVDAVLKDVQERQQGYDNFLHLMGETANMRKSKSVAASILVGELSGPSTNHN